VSGPGVSATRDGSPASITITTKSGTYSATDSDNGGVVNVNVSTSNGSCSIR
jgi:hypothetical protein